MLMTAGGLVAATSSNWELQETARLVAGIGGVLLNVLLTKMVADWFAGKEIASAMGIFVNSWPVGIALALLVLPGIAQATTLNVALLAVSAITALAFVALAVGYRAPVQIEFGQPSQNEPARRGIGSCHLCRANLGAL